jgi:thiamine-monophosphate kinase
LRAILDNLDDDRLQPCITRLNRPEARVSFAEQLTRHSACAIDISDGLVADLGHILEASNCGAEILLQDVPMSSAASYFFEEYNKGVIDWSILLTQGDDYELCFTVSSKNEAAVKVLAEEQSLKICCIGDITENTELLFIDSDGNKESFVTAGFKHF